MELSNAVIAGMKFCTVMSLTVAHAAPVYAKAAFSNTRMNASSRFIPEGRADIARLSLSQRPTRLDSFSMRSSVPNGRTRIAKFKSETFKNISVSRELSRVACVFEPDVSNRSRKERRKISPFGLNDRKPFQLRNYMTPSLRRI